MGTATLCKKCRQVAGCILASFPGSCVGEEEREPGTHCSRMRQVPLVICILLHYTKITVNFCLPACSKAALHGYTPCRTLTGGFEVKTNTALMVRVCIASFEAISEHQRKRLRPSRAVALSWNGQPHGRPHGQLLQARS